MASPFPGMDPYLEDERWWPSFHHHFIHSVYQILLPGLVDRYRGRIQQRKYVSEMPLFTSIIREEHVEEYIEISRRSDNKLITIIEMVTQTNKGTQQGFEAYHQTRRMAKSLQANMVEIDLLLQGRYLIDHSREGIPICHYAVMVTRSTHMDRHELYPGLLQKSLPRFKIPLASDDRDTVMDLQACFDRAYDSGNFEQKLDYSRDLKIPLSNEDKSFVDSLMKSFHKKKK